MLDPIPFLRPRTVQRGLFFLHVPKTAGSFVVSLFKDRYGEDGCAPFLEQTILHALEGGAGHRDKRADFASAHSPMVLLRRADIHRNFDIFTVLRDPLERLASHMNWIDRFNHGVDRRSYVALRPEMKRLVQELAGIDADRQSDLIRFFRLDGLAKAQMFYNLQASMMFARSCKDILDLTDLNALQSIHFRRRLDRFAMCATLEQFKCQLMLAGLDIPMEEKVNGAKTRRFKPSPELAEAAARFVAIDQRLYDLVAQQTPDFSPVMGHLIRSPA